MPDNVCRICEREMLPRSDDPEPHVLERSQVDADLCIGCWWAQVELEKFLFRASDRAIIGNWTEGWLKEILKEPKRYL